MALATKERAATEAVENARQYVAKMSEPSRTRISEALECNIENYELFFGHPLADEKDPTMALLAEIPLPLEDMGGDLLMTNEEISRNIEILALEVWALKETVKEQGLLIANLNNLLRGVSVTLVVGQADPSEEQGKELWARAWAAHQASSVKS